LYVFDQCSAQSFRCFSAGEALIRGELVSSVERRMPVAQQLPKTND